MNTKLLSLLLLLFVGFISFTSAQSSCSDSTCTLDLSNSINIAGQRVSIDLFLTNNSESKVSLKIGEIKSPLLEKNGYWADSNSGIRITITDIISQNYAGGTQYVVFTYSAVNASSNVELKSSCIGQSCTLYQSESLKIIGQKVILENLLSSETDNSVVLKIGESISPRLKVGGYWADSNSGIRITITDIISQNYAGGTQFTKFDYTSVNSSNLGDISSTEFNNSKDNSEIESTNICDGCSVDNNCYTLGYRKSGNFCSETKNFTVQLETDKFCENNFECKSNVCAGEKCISVGLLQQILNWFKSLFG